MIAKKYALKQTIDFISYAQKNLSEIKTQDIKSRKLAKSSQKHHWTRSIVDTTIALEMLLVLKRRVKDIPLRV